MDLVAKIKLENKVYLELTRSNNKLSYVLDDDVDDDSEDSIDDKLRVYKKEQNGEYTYNSISYNEIKRSYVEIDKKLDYGFYLFVYNKTKLFVSFDKTKISFEIEDLEVEQDIDLR